MKRYAVWAVVAVLLAILALPSVPISGEKRFDIPIGNSPFIGPEGASVVIVEFVDYQ